MAKRYGRGKIVIEKPHDYNEWDDKPSITYTDVVDLDKLTPEEKARVAELASRKNEISVEDLEGIDLDEE